MALPESTASNSASSLASSSMRSARSSRHRARSFIGTRDQTDPRTGRGWGSALTIATRCVLILIGVGIAIQTFIVVEARPQDLITGIHGMADLIWRAIPPDFSKLPAP